MLYLCFILTALASTAQHSKAIDCPASAQGPISLPVRNVTLAGQHVRRGLEIQLGTPSQPLAVAVSSCRNNSYFYDQSPQCGSLVTDTCIANRGGAFNENLSSTLTSDAGFGAFGNRDPQLTMDDTTMLVNTDTFSVNSSFAIEQFQFGVPREDVGDFSVLGLAKDSSLLSMLRNAGDIASLSYSLYWGQTGTSPEHQLDGGLVIGGLDMAKAVGQNYTTSLNRASACPSGMLVSVSDMTLEFPNGTSASIMGTGVGQTVNYCILPEYPLITMPLDLWDQWVAAYPQSATDGNADARAGGQPNVWGLVYPPSLAFDGDLKITIDNSLDITIPGHQLVQYYYTFDDNGDAVVNGSVLELMINPLQDVNKNDLPQFGMTFLQAAYLHVNFDDDTFTLWQANPTDSESLVAVGQSVLGCSATPTTATTSSSRSAVATASPTHTPNATLSSGTIAAIAVCVVVAVALVAGATFWVLARRRRSLRRGAAAEGVRPSDKSETGGYPPMLTQKPELDASNTGINHSQKRPQHVLPSVVELPSERYE
ncbi:hypothetical protein A1O7_09601 [Cladophialophora yegresii CBS 114405]|uniref:Peptidase A1 domain-containing protein n=1 Tax=Cladophialophora yegresii CBS 114405 TaxID=1182544 RepID=W9VFJ6_9EURO|nr:uncharacterized protein A1O7_09601 [Cladophialophora yegresii CBS 114405]EXJ54263.1 hypothetical protein A1O7_09601 [Cladophialophora yegresii CBS 114405]